MGRIGIAVRARDCGGGSSRGGSDGGGGGSGGLVVGGGGGRGPGGWRRGREPWEGAPVCTNHPIMSRGPAVRRTLSQRRGWQVPTLRRRLATRTETDHCLTVRWDHCLASRHPVRRARLWVAATRGSARSAREQNAGRMEDEVRDIRQYLFISLSAKSRTCGRRT